VFTVRGKAGGDVLLAGLSLLCRRTCRRRRWCVTSWRREMCAEEEFVRLNLQAGVDDAVVVWSGCEDVGGAVRWSYMRCWNPRRQRSLRAVRADDAAVNLTPDFVVPNYPVFTELL